LSVCESENSPATVDFLAVTAVQWDGKYLAVSHDDQFAIIVITVLGLIWI
jgi:hypothetical protein